MGGEPNKIPTSAKRTSAPAVSKTKTELSWELLLWVHTFEVKMLRQFLKGFTLHFAWSMTMVGLWIKSDSTHPKIIWVWKSGRPNLMCHHQFPFLFAHNWGDHLHHFQTPNDPSGSDFCSLVIGHPRLLTRRFLSGATHKNIMQNNDM